MYNKKNIKKNPLCSSTQKFYIKDVKKACNFVGHSKLKPIDHVAFFKLKEESATLTEITASTTVSKKREKLLLYLIQVSKYIQ